jgi:16S rRNA (cytidine1402-2'-O)-methyltransferase
VTTPPSSGTLYLVPNALDTGTAAARPDLDEVLAVGVIRLAARLEYWVVENAKSARQFLKRVEATIPLERPLQQLSIVQLPGPDKGRRGLANPTDLDTLLAPARAGNDIGLLSEAGLPAVADPGAALVQRAHATNIRVTALPGPSALLLALAASGLNGQGFEFVGYLPVDAGSRGARLRELEALSRRDATTRIMIETPYRNQALLDAMLQHLQPSTRVSVSCGLTLPAGFSRTASVADWRASPLLLPSDVPAVFLLLAAGKG